jgi:hypothetical protein
MKQETMICFTFVPFAAFVVDLKKRWIQHG